MFLAFLIISALLASAFITGYVKNTVYSFLSKEEIDEENMEYDVIFTALGVVIISNLVPFTLGAMIGIYAIF